MSPDTRLAHIEVGHKAYGMDFYKEIVTVEIQRSPRGIAYEYGVSLVGADGCRHAVDKIYARNRVISAVEGLIQPTLERLVFSGQIANFITRVPIQKKITKYSIKESLCWAWIIAG